MPGYRGHVFGGVLLWLLTVCLAGSTLLVSIRPIESLLCTIAGALFPDVDTHSQGQRLFYFAMFLAYPVLLLNQQFSVCLLLGFFCCIPPFVRHRGIFHRYWFLTLLTACASLLLLSAFPSHHVAIICNASFFLLGSCSHIMLDRFC